MTEVKVREKCGRCKGVGIVQHPVWADFWAQHPSATFVVCNSYIENWFRSRGCLEFRDGEWCEPPEEIDCWECEGRKYQEAWLPLREVKTLLAGVV